MDKSIEIFVTPSGLARVVYDSHRRADLVIRLYGVHDSGWPRAWVWNVSKGPPRSLTNKWFQTEGGREYQKFIDNLLDGINK